MIYRWPDFLAVVWLDSFPTSFPQLPSANCLSYSVFLCVAGRAYWRESAGGEVVGGAKSCGGEKAWSSINHWLIFVYSLQFMCNICILFVSARLLPFTYLHKISNKKNGKQLSSLITRQHFKIFQTWTVLEASFKTRLILLKVFPNE
jgi:hypothetical protein